MIELKHFDSLSSKEWDAALDVVVNYPLSGYLAGQERGGIYVQRLEEEWADTFKVKHAIAVNSATSGLLAASFAIGLKPGDKFICPAMTMSATCAAPMFTGAKPYFMDVSDEDFGLNPSGGFPEETKAIFTTNLFGHPSKLAQLEWDKDKARNPTYLIEDNAQSPFAWCRSGYAGTMGDVGIFSLNYHKPIQCGEGGIVVTDDDDLAFWMRNFINHGENAGGTAIGLNLRMPEVCAAIGLAQLRRGEEIIQGRIAQAEAIIAATSNIPGIRSPVTREGCRHVYYAIPFLIDNMLRPGTANSDVNVYWHGKATRTRICSSLRRAGIPIVEGYVPPLYRLPAFASFKRECPVAERLHDESLFYFENCAFDVSLDQAEQIGEAFHAAMKEIA